MSTLKKQDYPLLWPMGWPVERNRLQNRQFNTTVSKALKELEKEVRLLGGTNLVLSSNYTLSNQNPKEPGVVAYFDYEKMAVAVPCDRWTKIEHNVLAIAKTVNAMRGMERWGAKQMIRAMFTGFKQLPQSTTRTWWEVLGVSSSASFSELQAAFRSKSKVCHPDTGGSHEAFAELNSAYQQATQSLKNI